MIILFPSMALTCSGLVFTLLIAIVYFIKKKYKNIENNIYRFILITTIFLLVLEIICVFTMANRASIPIINEILCRIYILGDIVWISAILIYIRSFHAGNIYTKFSDFFDNKEFLILMIISSVCFFISCCLPIKYTSGPNNEFYVIGGQAVYVLYFVFAFVGGYMLYVLFKYRNAKKDSFIKRAPIYIFLVFYFIMGVIQLNYADFNDLTFIFSFCVISMYFTFENQDLKLVQELEVAKKDAEEADREKTEFLSKMSHEIRTPMNAIMGFSESLINEKNLNLDTMKKDVTNIHQAGTELLEIINNILDISRIESGKEKIENEEYYIGDIVFELSSFIESKINPKQVKFIINVDENIPSKIKGDKLKIYKILLLILNNAVKYTRNGEIVLTISGEKNDGILELSFVIKDTGLGIREEDFDKIFKKFSKFEIKDNDDGIADNGTGLGLVIAKDLVDLLSGNITFQSEYRIGTIFSIKLKQEILDDTKIGNLFASREHISIKDKDKFYFDCSKYRVLIIDDNKLNLRVAKRLLEPYKFKIDFSESGAEGIEKIKSGEKYDIIFLDHMMPEMDGIETIKILKKMFSKSSPKIVAMTANVITEVKNTYFEVGFDDYLAKPIDAKELNKLLRKYINKDK